MVFFKGCLTGFAVCFLLFCCAGSYYHYQSTRPSITAHLDCSAQMALVTYYYNVLNHPQWYGAGPLKNRRASFLRWVRKDFTVPSEMIDDPGLAAWVVKIRGC